MVLRMRLTKKICRKKYLQVKIALEQPSPCCPPHPPHPPDPKLICEERSGYGNFLKPPSATQHWISGGAGGANDSNMSEYVPMRVVWIWVVFFYIFFSSTVPVTKANRATQIVFDCFENSFGFYRRLRVGRPFGDDDFIHIIIMTSRPRIWARAVLGRAVVEWLLPF